MSGTRFSLLLATTAIVMVLAGPSHKAFAGPTTDADISAAVPMPESANLAPPTVEDIATVTEPPSRSVISSSPISRRPDLSRQPWLSMRRSAVSKSQP